MTSIFSVVYGWLNNTYSGEERFQKHRLKIGFRKGRDAIKKDLNVSFDVVPIDGRGIKGIP